MKKTIVYTFLIVGLVVIIWMGYLRCTSPVTTVILVRHTERVEDNLNVVGLQRADTLAAVLSKTAITAIFVTEFKRTWQTARPTATALGIKPIERPAAEFNALVDLIRSDHEGDIILIVGHTNTIPSIIKGFEISPPPVINNVEYDDLFLVHLYPFQTATLTHLKYGLHLN
jgi:broad specificity phosphatase PhoE